MGWIGAGAADLASTVAAVGRISMHWRLGPVGLMLHPDWPLDGPKVEVGWTLQRSAWGRGYATEGARASLEFGFRELGLPQIFSMTRPDNARSRAVMERCGLTQRGELEFHGWRQVHYAVDREGWPPQGDPLPRSEIRRVG